MSTHDLFEDGFPHGTPEGYTSGCRGAGCPAGIEIGLTCRAAWQMSHGDYRYQKLARAGATPAEIAAALNPTPQHQEPAKPGKPAIPADVDELEEELEQLEPEPVNPTPATIAKPRKPKPAPAPPAPPAPKLTPSPEQETPMSTPTLDADTRATIRAWAAEHDIVLGKGKIPDNVLGAALANNPALAGKYWQPKPRASRSPHAPSAAGEQLEPDAHAVRVWAREQGLDVGDRGKIRTDILQAYHEAHPNAAQPLAESSQDRMPGRQNAPADAPSQSPTTVEPDEAGRREEMGHPYVDEDLTEISTETVATIIAELDDADQVPAEISDSTTFEDAWRAVTGMHPLSIAERSDMLDETRRRIHAPDHRPDWATVTISQDVERARGIAVRLEQELAHVEEQRDQAYASLELVLDKWADATARVRLLTALLEHAATEAARKCELADILQRYLDEANRENTRLRKQLERPSWLRRK